MTAEPGLWVERAGHEPEGSAASPAGLGAQWEPGPRSSGFSSDLAPDLSYLLSGVVPCIMEHQKDTPRLSHLGVYREDVSLSCMCEDTVCYPSSTQDFRLHIIGGKLCVDYLCRCFTIPRSEFLSGMQQDVGQRESLTNE